MGNGFNNFGEFQNVYDEFRVNACKFHFRPRYTEVDAQDALPTGGPPAIATGVNVDAMIVIDPATTTAPSGLQSISNKNSFLQQGNVKIKNAMKPFNVYFKPRVEGQLFGTGTAAYVRRCPWVKTTESGIDFRGFHVYLSPNNLTNVLSGMVWDVYLTVYCQFRNLK